MDTIMLHGCRKQIYYIKNTGGKYFEEAYLILKKDVPEISGKSYSADLAEEAERIIRNAGNSFDPYRKTHLPLGRAAAFALGAASSSALIGTLALIIGLS